MTDIARRIADLTPAQRALLQRRLMDGRQESSVSPVIPRRSDDIRDSTSGEERLWFLDQVDGASALYNISIALDVTGVIDVQAAEKALRTIIQRHEPLRTHYTSDGGELRVVVDEAIEFTLRIEDTCVGDRDSTFTEDDDASGLDRALRAEASTPFALGRDLMLRGVLYRRVGDESTLQITMHHIVTDGWSMDILRKEFSECYNAAISGRDPVLPPLPIRFGDYASWMRGAEQRAVLERSAEHWADVLRGSSTLLEVPTDRPRPKFPTGKGALRTNAFSADSVRAIQEFARAENATPFMVLLAALFGVMHSYSGQSHFIIGTPMAARSRPETEGMIGFFANTVPLPGDLSADPSFRELVQQLRGVALDAYANQDVPFEKLVQQLNPERDPGRSPLIQVMLALEKDASEGIILDGLTVTSRSVHSGTSKFEITVHVNLLRDAANTSIEYNSDIFEPDTIDRLHSHLDNFVRNAIARPERSVSAIGLLGESERDTLLRSWNATAADYPRTTPLAQLIEEQVERTPDSIAVVFGETVVTYRELNERANQLARELVRCGAQPGSLIGLYIERSAEMMVALLAIIKAGGGYVPLEPAYPQQRINYMIADSGIGILITQRSLTSSVIGFDGVIVEVDSADWAGNGATNLAVSVSDDEVAYIIYTSGSTGKPKGARIRRRGLTNILWTMRERMQLTAADRWLAITTISFDFAGTEIWLPWLLGAPIVVANREETTDVDQLRALIGRHDITVLQATPTTWAMLFTAGWQGKRDLKCMVGGEKLSQTLASRLTSSVGAVWNVYGPTETTVWSTTFHVTDGEQPVLIGRPAGNTRCYILDKHQEPQPIGVAGELYIAGDGVAQGYQNNPDLTRERFIQDPFDNDESARMYRTGDIARYRSDGNIEYLGRRDDQVKIRGFRIELGEIENALEQHTGVRQAAATVREDTPGDRWLVAYIVPEGDMPAPAELRQYLKASLPAYMIPTVYVQLGALPLTSSGKVARRELPVPQDDAAPHVFDERPRNPVEHELTRLWQELLHVPSVGITDDFFELGGHSLLAVTMMERIATIFGSKPPLSVLFAEPTIQRLAKSLVDRAGFVEQGAVCIREGVSGRTPFFLLHGDYMGGGLYSRKLIRYLDPDQPVYVLPPHQPGGPETITEMATDILPQIREIQSRGPYFIAGYCNGGAVALEIACQLQAAGESIGFLALIDLGARNVQLASLNRVIARVGRIVGSHRSKQIDTFIRLREPALRFLETELPPIDRASTIGARVEFGIALGWLVIRRVVRRIWRAALTIVGLRARDVERPVPHFNEPPSEERIRLERNAYIGRAMSSYVPSSYSGTITVIGSTGENGAARPDQMRHWQSIATAVDAFEIPGTHAGIVTSEIEGLGKVLREQMARAG